MISVLKMLVKTPTSLVLCSYPGENASTPGYRRPSAIGRFRPRQSGLAAGGDFLAGLDDAQEINSLEAGASHQRPVDVGTSQQLLGVVRPHASPILDDNPGGGRLAERLDEPAADEGMDRLCLVARGRQARADGPDRLIGQHGAGHLLRREPRKRAG